MTWLHRKRFACITKQLVWLFIHTDDGTINVKWLAVYIQSILHAGDKGGIVSGWYLSTFFQVGFEFVFF